MITAIVYVHSCVLKVNSYNKTVWTVQSSVSSHRLCNKQVDVVLLLKTGAMQIANSSGIKYRQYMLL